MDAWWRKQLYPHVSRLNDRGLIRAYTTIFETAPAPTAAADRACRLP
jgi:hypothetical protein